MPLKPNSVIVLVIFFAGLITAFTSYHYTTDKESVEEVTKVVERSYINGAFNALDTDAMAKGFHREFAIFSADGESLGRYPIDTWIEGIEKRKGKPDFDLSQNVWEHKLPQVDVTGGAASVKVELFKDGEHVYTDYLSLLKFESGWKIVAKVYHKHTDS